MADLVGASRRWRAVFGALLLFAMAVPTFLQVAVAVLAPFLTVEFGLSAGQLGVLGTALFLPAALAAPVAGYLVDALGARRITAMLFALAGASIMGFALAPSFGWLIAMAATNGLSHAGSNPATNRLISTYILPGRQGLLVGVKQSGVKVSQFAAGAILPLGAVAFGWREALLASAVVCFTGIVAVFTVLPVSAKSEVRRSNSRGRTPVGSTVWRLAAFAFFMAVGQSAIYLYLPLYSYDQLGLDVRTAGLTVGLIGFLAVFARIAWGPAAERFTSAAVPLVILSVGSIVSQAAIWSAAAIGIGPLWFGVLGISLTAAVWNTVANYAIITRTGGNQTGRASGILQTAFLLGLSAGPVLAGALIEGSGSYHLAWLGVCVMFAMAAAVAIQWWSQERRMIPELSRSR